MSENKKHSIIELIEQHNTKIITLRVDLIDICKDKNCALMLAQIIYWQKSIPNNKKGWMYKSASDWFDEIRLTQQEVRTCDNKLIKLGFIEMKKSVAEGHNTRFYRLKENAIKQALDNLYNGKFSFVETTVETTNDIVETTNDIVASNKTIMQNQQNHLLLATNYTESTQESTQESTSVEYPEKPTKTNLLTEDSKNKTTEDSLISEIEKWVLQTYSFTSKPKNFDLIINDLVQKIDKKELLYFWQQKYDQVLISRHQALFAKNGKALTDVEILYYDKKILLADYPAYKENLEGNRKAIDRELTQMREELKIDYSRLNIADYSKPSKDTKEMFNDDDHSWD